MLPLPQQRTQDPTLTTERPFLRKLASFNPIAALKYLLLRLHLLVLPWPLVLYFEYLNRGSVTKTLQWAWSSPSIFILNVLIATALLLLLAAIAGRTWIAYTVLSIALAVVGFISGIKFVFLGVPLLPWDVFLSKEATDISHYLDGIWNRKLILYTLLFAACSFAVIRYARVFNAKFKWPEKLTFAAIGLLLLCSVYYGKPLDLNKRFHILNYTWSQQTNYKVNGFLIATSMNISSIFIPEPAGYNKDRMLSIRDGVTRRTNIDPDTKPNIIVVLSESLWDITQLSKVTFDRDPLPFLHSLQKKITSGTMLSPEYGGGTSNVEFEVMTGNSMRFMPQGTTPYIQYVNRPIEALPGILARQGYATTAITPTDSWYYNSRKVYNFFGFQQYISLDFFEPKMKGTFPADSEVAKLIMDRTAKTPGPDFIFANTLENHLPYSENKFKDVSVHVSGPVSAAYKAQIETYATGAADADLMLQTLVEHYTAVGEPTIIVFFGDHKPSLGNNYGVYKQGGYMLEDDPDMLHKVHDVPVVVWDNYLPEHKDKLDISPAFLAPYILNLARKEGTPYMDYLYGLMQRHPIIPPENEYAKYNLIPDDLADYRQMQYDMLFGKQYAVDRVGHLQNKGLSPDYVMGFGPLVIDSVSPKRLTVGVPFQQEGGESTMLLSGQNFSPKSYVTVNGRQMRTKLMPDGKLKAYIPNVEYEKTAKLTVKVQVRDSLKIVLAESNPVTITVDE